MIYIILFLSLVLRLISLNQSFWLDEATSATVAKSFNLIEITTKFAPGDFHPPFYYLLLKVWTGLTGVSEISTRLLSVIIGVFTVYLVYLLGKKIMNESLGMVAALLFSTAPLHVYYSQEARMYVLEVFLVTLSFYYFICLLGKNRLKEWLGFSFSLLLLGLTDYLPLFILPVFWIYALIAKKTRKWWGAFLLSHVPLLVGYSFWSPILMVQLRSGLNVQTSSPGWWRALGGSSLKELFLTPVKFMIGRISFENEIIYGLIVAGFGLLNTFLLFVSRKKVKKVMILWLWLLVPFLCAFILGFKIAIFSYFRLIFVLPAFYLLSGVGLLSLKKKFFPLIFLSVIFLNMTFSLIYLLNPTYHRENWRDLVGTIQEKSQGKNYVVVFPAQSQQEAYRYYDSDSKILTPVDLKGDDDKIWLMRYVWDIVDPQNSAVIKLEELDYQKVSELNSNGVVVWEYNKIK